MTPVKHRFHGDPYRPCGNGTIGEAVKLLDAGGSLRQVAAHFHMRHQPLVRSLKNYGWTRKPS